MSNNSNIGGKWSVCVPPPACLSPSISFLFLFPSSILSLLLLKSLVASQCQSCFSFSPSLSSAVKLSVSCFHLSASVVSWLAILLPRSPSPACAEPNEKMSGRAGVTGAACHDFFYVCVCVCVWQRADVQMWEEKWKTCLLLLACLPTVNSFANYGFKWRK